MPKPTPSLNQGAVDTPSLDADMVKKLRISSFDGMSDKEIAERTGDKRLSLSVLLNEIIDTHWSTVADRPAATEPPSERLNEKIRKSIDRASLTAIDLLAELSKLPSGLAPIPPSAWCLKALTPSHSNNVHQLEYLVSRLISEDSVAMTFFPEPNGPGLRASTNSENPRDVRKIVVRAKKLALQLAGFSDKTDALETEETLDLERVLAQLVKDANVTLAALDNSTDVMRTGQQPKAMRREILITELYALRYMLTERRDRYSKGDTLGGPFGILAATVVATVEEVELDSLERVSARSSSLGARITIAADAVDAVTTDIRPNDSPIWWNTYVNVRKSALGRLRAEENAPVSDKRVNSPSG